MYMVMFVLDDPEQLDAVLDAWDSIGVSGVTILESSGINRRRSAIQVGTPFMAGMNRLMSGSHVNNFTLLTIVNDKEVAQSCAQAAQAIVGDLSQPNTGVLAAWPLEIVLGIPDPGNKSPR